MPRPYHKHIIKAVDFFCGGGGMTCGLRQAGIKVIAGIDIEKACKSTYEDNNPGSKYICCDITTLSVDFLEKKFHLKKNDDNLVFVGCSPCQFYSIINTNRKKSYESRKLLMEFKRFVDYYNPGFVLVENVPGIISNKKSVLPDFLDFLDKKKYRHQEQVVNMSFFGIPQTRRRFSLLATRLKGITPTLPTPDEHQAILREFIGQWNGFPVLEAGHVDNSPSLNWTASLSALNMRRLLNTPHNGGSRLAWKDNPELQLDCYIGKDDSFRDVYGRLCWEKPSATITTNFVKITSGRFAHPDENRGLSLREGATLQTFPENYIFKAGTLGANAKIIGNAVPPEYGRRLGEVIKKLKQEYDNGTI